MKNLSISTKAFFTIWLATLLFFPVSILIYTHEISHGNFLSLLPSANFIVGVLSFFFFIILYTTSKLWSVLKRRFSFFRGKEVSVRFALPVTMVTFLIISYFIIGWLYHSNIESINTVQNPPTYGYTPIVNTNTATHIDAESLKSEIYVLINKEREKVGLKPLKINSALERAAFMKADHMVKNSYWSHIAPDGTEPWSFIVAAGYGYSFAGENLARDYFDARSTVASWMESAEHKKNVIDSRYTEHGIEARKATLQGVSGVLIVHFFGAPIPPKTNNIISYHEWCTNTDISIYENELITKKSSDGNIYSMTQGDWNCYENYLNNNR